MGSLFDYRGETVKTDKLSEELAAPSITGVRTPLYDSVANILTPARLATVIIGIDQNDDITEYLTLAEEMEERELHYRSVLSTRKLAVNGMNIMVEAVSDAPADVKVADFVREQLCSDTFDAAILDILDGIGKGYSVTEIIWDQSKKPWVPKEYKWRDPRFFQFDQLTGSEIRMRDEADLANGVKLAPYKFIYHQPKLKSGLPIRCGLARLAVIAYLCKSYAIKDWLAFAEVFGMPIRIGKYGTDASDAQKTALLSAVANIGIDASCIIPESMMVELVEPKSTTGGDKLFMNLANWLDSQVSKGVLGQTATTEGTPGRLGSDDAQADVREDILRSDSKQLAATINRDLVRPLVDFNFTGSIGRYPKVKLIEDDDEDLKILAEAIGPFIDRGLTVEASVIRDKFGIPEPAEGAEILKPKGGSAPVVQPPDDSKGNPMEGDEGDEDDEDAEETRSKIVAELLGAVRRGETLTTDQRMLLSQAFGEDTDKEIAQAVVCHKTHFKTVDAARDWLLKHDFYDKYGAKETDTVFIFVQVPKEDFIAGSFRTKRIPEDGVHIVIGRIKGRTLVTTDTAAAQPVGDEIDDLVDESLSDWERIMDPVFKPVLAHAKKSKSYQEFLNGLEGVLTDMDSTEFVKSIAMQMFKSRGLGDSTDEL